MERKFVSLYGTRAGILSVDTILGYGPRAAGLVMVDVDFNAGEPPALVALTPLNARVLRDALTAGVAECARVSMARPDYPTDHRLEPKEEIASLIDAGMHPLHLQAAERAGLLGRDTSPGEGGPNARLVALGGSRG